MKAPRQPSNRSAMLLAFFPGAGHFYLERYLTGAFLFACFVTALNGILLASILQSSEHTSEIRQVAIASLVIVWAVSVLHTYKQSYGTDRASLARSRGLLLRAALVDYLRDDLVDAARKLEQAIALDVDWLDPDPLFHLGVVMLRLAERRAARSDKDGARTARRRSQWAFRNWLARDSSNKWRADIARESKRMRHVLSATGRLRAITASGRFVRRSATESSAFPELTMSSSWRRIPSGVLKREPASPKSELMKEIREELEGAAAEASEKSGPFPATRQASRPNIPKEVRARRAELRDDDDDTQKFPKRGGGAVPNTRKHLRPGYGLAEDPVPGRAGPPSTRQHEGDESDDQLTPSDATARAPFLPPPTKRYDRPSEDEAARWKRGELDLDPRPEEKGAIPSATLVPKPVVRVDPEDEIAQEIAEEIDDSEETAAFVEKVVEELSGEGVVPDADAEPEPERPTPPAADQVERPDPPPSQEPD